MFSLTQGLVYTYIFLRSVSCQLLKETAPQEQQVYLSLDMCFLYHSPIKGTRIYWRNNWIKGWEGNIEDKIKEVIEHTHTIMEICQRDRGPTKRAPNGQMWKNNNKKKIELDHNSKGKINISESILIQMITLIKGEKRKLSQVENSK